MDELTIGDKIYVSSKKAAKITGYAKDYVGQLCREGRVEARLVGRNWYVLEASILEHRFGVVSSDSSLSNEVHKTLPVEERQEETATFEDATEEEVYDAPIYTREEPEDVPRAVVEEKVSEISESKQVLSDMQSAWQEWFSKEATREKVLPDGEEDFSDTLLPVVQEVEPVQVSTEPYVEEAEEVTVEMHKSTDAVLTEQIRHTGHKTVDLDLSRVEGITKRREQARNAQKRVKGSPRTSKTLRVVFVATAIICVCIALVGTGAVSELGSRSLAKYGVESSSWLQVLGGESSYKLSK